MESSLKEGNYYFNRDENDLDLPQGRGRKGGHSDDDNNDDDDKPGKGGGAVKRQPPSQMNIGVTVEKFESEIDLLRDEIMGLKEHQEDLMENFREDLDDIKSLLLKVVSPGGRPSQPPTFPPSQPPPFLTSQAPSFRQQSRDTGD